MNLRGPEFPGMPPWPVMAIATGVALVALGLSGYTPRPLPNRSAFPGEARLLMAAGAGVVVGGWMARRDDY